MKSVNLNGIEYFDVMDIKDNHPDLKVDIKKIIMIRKNVYITAENIQEITAFEGLSKHYLNKIIALLQ